jgi:hypothetical protein
MSEPHTVTQPLPLHFIVMDGRAVYDPNCAMILEIIEEVNYERVWKRFQKDYIYQHLDAVLTIWHEYQKGALKFYTRVSSLEEIVRVLEEFQTNE